MEKLKIKPINLKPRINSANGQINFALKKSSLTKELLSKIKNLKSIELKPCNFKFEEDFENKFEDKLK